jgi:hypothetical protein
MKYLIASAAATAAALSFASAQEGTNYFSAGIGAFTISDDVVTSNSFAETTNDISTGVSFYALAGRKLSKYLAMEGEFGIYTADWDGFDNGVIGFGCDAGPDEECDDPAIQTFTLTGNLVVSGDMSAAFRPYAGVGAGVMRTSYGLEDVDGQFGFGYLAKAGADFKVGARSRLGGQYTYLGAPDAELEGPLGFNAEFPVAGHAFLLTYSSGF